jgi:hypothetical protein
MLLRLSACQRLRLFRQPAYRHADCHIITDHVDFHCHLISIIPKPTVIIAFCASGEAAEDTYVISRLFRCLVSLLRRDAAWRDICTAS